MLEVEVEVGGPGEANNVRNEVTGSVLRSWNEVVLSECLGQVFFEIERCFDAGELFCKSGIEGEVVGESEARLYSGGAISTSSASWNPLLRTVGEGDNI